MAQQRKRFKAKLDRQRRRRARMQGGECAMPPLLEISEDPFAVEGPTKSSRVTRHAAGHVAADPCARRVRRGGER